MSFIIRDSLGPAMSNMNANFALFKRFNKVWANDGVFYDERLVYYNGSVRSDRAFINFIHMMGLTLAGLEKQSYMYVEEAWFCLVQPEDVAQEFTPTDAIDTMEPSTIPKVGDEIEITYEYNGVLNQRVKDDYGREIESEYNALRADTTYNIFNTATPEQIRDEILSDAGNYILSNKAPLSKGGFSEVNTNSANRGRAVNKDIKSNNWVGSEYNDPSAKHYKYKIPVCNITSTSRYGWYAAFDYNEQVFEQISVSEPNSELTDSFSFVVKYKVKKELEETDECVASFISYFNSYEGSIRKEASLPMKVMQQDYHKKYPLQNNDLWVDEKLSVAAVSKLKKKDFADLFSKMIDVDFEQEEDDKSWWEGLLAIVLVVVAVVLSVFTYGSSMAFFGTLGGLALSFGVGALSLSLASVILAYTAGESAAVYIKIIGKFANISSFLSKVFGIASVIKQSFKNVKFMTWMKSSFSVLKHYDENFGKTAELEVEVEEAQSELDDINRQNEENAPSNVDLLTDIDSVFVHSLGSYDAIAEVDLQTESLIENYLAKDPMLSVT